MLPGELNSLSKIELEAALRDEHNNLAPRPCRWCGELFVPRRRWQYFCSTKHRTFWNNNEAKLLANALEQRVRVLECENAELRAELAKCACMRAREG